MGGGGFERSVGQSMVHRLHDTKLQSKLCSPMPHPPSPLWPNGLLLTVGGAAK